MIVLLTALAAWLRAASGGGPGSAAAETAAGLDHRPRRTRSCSTGPGREAAVPGWLGRPATYTVADLTMLRRSW